MQRRMASVKISSILPQGVLRGPCGSPWASGPLYTVPISASVAQHGSCHGAEPPTATGKQERRGDVVRRSGIVHFFLVSDRL